MTCLSRRADLLLTLAVAAAAFVLYSFTLAPSVQMGDAGEFQFVPYIAGIAHATGYPLFTILGWAWTHVFPVGAVAHRMTLLSALWGSVAVGLTYQVARWSFCWVAPECPVRFRRALSVLAAALLAVSATFWSQAVIAEIYTLNAAFVAAVLYLMLRLWDAADSRRDDAGQWLIALAITYGFGLTHHRTMLLLLPGLAIACWAAVRRGGLAWRRLWPWVLAGLILPQLLYLYIPLRAPNVPYAELALAPGRTLVLYERSLAGFLDLVAGGAFSGDLAGGPVTAERGLMALELLHQQFAWAGLALGAMGLLGCLRRRAWLFLALTGLSFLAYIGFGLAYFIGDVYVMFAPSYLIFAAWIALGVWEVARLFSRTAVVPVLVVLLSLLLPVFLLWQNYPQIDRSRDADAAQMWLPILAHPLPEGSVLVSNDRDEIMPLWYYQYVDGTRPDLLGLFPLIVREPGYGDVSQVVDRALESGRPTFLIKPMPGLELKYQLEPQGPVTRVAASHAGRQPGHVLDVPFGQAVRLTGYDQPQAPVRPGDAAEVTLFWQSRQETDRALSSFVHLLDASGNQVAGSDHPPGGAYYPTSLWKPGELLLDSHQLTVPPGLAPGAYRLTAGLYAWPSMERVGEEAAVGELVVE